MTENKKIRERDIEFSIEGEPEKNLEIDTIKNYKKDLNAVFWQRVDLVIQSRNLNYSKLAQAIGMSAQALSNIKTGTLGPNFVTVIAIARYLEVSTDELFGLTESPEELKKDRRSKTEIALVKFKAKSTLQQNWLAMKYLDDEERRALNELLMSIIGFTKNQRNELFRATVEKQDKREDFYDPLEELDE